MGVQLTVIGDTEVQAAATFYDFTQTPPAPADPIQVAFSFGVAGIPPTVDIYGSGESQIVRLDVGVYQRGIDPTGMVEPGSNATLVVQVDGNGVGGVQATGYGTALIMSAPFVSPLLVPLP
jgi:hypothetical protein